MKPIENWRDSWRFAVQWVQGMGASAMAAWLLLTDEQRTAILGLLGVTPDQAVAFTALAFFLTGMAARVVQQEAIA